ncbi:DUF4398 domain-containing protein [Deferribacter autotrophicus]|uniref:DUF4398 domain-containing protein n=1 Tax=Deferribacter autotrophicus TaxID=500465 RepID=A0A5A8F734_9BACT|nr:DUF4398 domain-containing protein [Deferribacter autotrophicus]KAA0259515.1 DUF4398 domain-containing protein [Deferribacter autotrophicus]
MRYAKLFLLLVLATAFLFACAKPPMKKYNDAQKSVNEAWAVDADKCAPKEYKAAQKAFEEAQKELEEAKNHTFKGKYYDRAEAKLEEAKAKAEKAKKVAQKRREAADKVGKELDELRDEIDAIKDDAKKYDPVTFAEVEDLYEKAQKAVDDCEPGKANMLRAQIEGKLDKIKENIAIAKAEEMKKAMKQKEMAKIEKYTVVKGDCLWKISELKYMNPFMWPLIYWTNKDMIKDPDLIYPGQVFKIRKDIANNEKDKAINFAKNRGPWSLFDGK